MLLWTCSAFKLEKFNVILNKFHYILDYSEEFLYTVSSGLSVHHRRYKSLKRLTLGIEPATAKREGDAFPLR